MTAQYKEYENHSLLGSRHLYELKQAHKKEGVKGVIVCDVKKTWKDTKSAARNITHEMSKGLGWTAAYLAAPIGIPYFAFMMDEGLWNKNTFESKFRREGKDNKRTQYHIRVRDFCNKASPYLAQTGVGIGDFLIQDINLRKIGAAAGAATAATLLANPELDKVSEIAFQYSVWPFHAVFGMIGYGIGLTGDAKLCSIERKKIKDLEERTKTHFKSKDKG